MNMNMNITKNKRNLSLCILQVFMPLLSFSQLKNAEAASGPQSRAVSRQDTSATDASAGEGEKEPEAKVRMKEK